MNSQSAVKDRRTKDLTEGNIASQLLLFALPILVGQIFQNLYNSVDAIVVGNAVGKTALAAVTSCSDISMLLTGFFTGFSTGAGVLFSQSFGGKDYKKLHDSIHTAITFSLIIGVAMAAIGIVFSPFLLSIVDCPEDVYGEALAYLRVYLIGILFTSIYNIGAGVLRAVGDSRSPLYFLIITSIVNIILDLIFVVLLPWKVVGAAIATILSQFLSVALVFRKLIMTDAVYHVSLKDLRMDKQILKEVLTLGLPSAIQSSLIAISNLFVQRYVNSFGSSAMAGIGAAKKIDRFVGMAAQSMGMAVATFVAQNVGAKKMKRAFSGIRVCVVMNLLYVLLVGAAAYACAEQLISIFTSDQESVFYGVEQLRTMLPLYCFQVLNAIYANSVRGFGKSFVVMICSITGMIVCRQIFLAVSMSIAHDVHFVYVGFPLGWACAAILVIAYYLIVIRRNYKNV